MVGTNRINLAKQALKDHRGKEFFLEDLKSIIRKCLASNEKTIHDYLISLRSAGIIEEFETSSGSGITKWFVNIYVF